MLPRVRKGRRRRRSKAALNTPSTSKRPQTGWTKNKLPLCLAAEAPDRIQPGARIFVFLLLGYHEVSRAAIGKVAAVSAGNSSRLSMRTKCPAYLVIKAEIMGLLCFYVLWEKKHWKRLFSKLIQVSTCSTLCSPERVWIDNIVSGFCAACTAQRRAVQKWSLPHLYDAHTQRADILQTHLNDVSGEPNKVWHQQAMTDVTTYQYQ